MGKHRKTVQQAEDNTAFRQRIARSYAPFMKHSEMLYREIYEKIRPSLSRDMNVLELALAEISQVLKPGWILYAPTFVHGSGMGFRLRMRLLTMAGFKVYSKWTAVEFEQFILEHNFQVKQTALLGGSLAPLCYLEASVKK